MQWFVTLAGSIVRITGPDGILFATPGTLTPFVEAPQEYEWEIQCEVVEKLSEPEGQRIFADSFRRVFGKENGTISYIGSVEKTWEDAYIRVHREDKKSVAEMKKSVLSGTITPRVVLTALEAEHIAVANKGFLLHASCIRYGDGAILFTAPSGTGKSTQADLWMKHRGAEIMNGDRIMVQWTDHGCKAIGVPFSGSSGICKKCELPVKAIVYLSQAEENRIRPLVGIEAFRRIWEGCSLHSWNRSDVDLCAQTVEQTISQIPIFHLACTPDESAVIALERALNHNED